MNAPLLQVQARTGELPVTSSVVESLAAQQRRFDTLVAALRDPSVYPHPSGPIEVVETHISTVVLTGEFAYKLKKPLALGFLDFSSPQRRKFFCQEELRLNQRLAPELYLDVVTFTGSPSTPLMRNYGDGFEYAVRMHQFDQSRLIPAMLARGELRREHVVELAQVIADFHTVQAAPLDPLSDYGTRARVLVPMLENFAQVRELLDDSHYEHRLRKLERWTRHQIMSLENVITRRRNNGFVRECHGDLHLNNIVIDDQDGVLIFDGIEFNPSLRWIDTASELAFTLMDFEFHGAASFANTLLSAYLEATGDYGALQMLDCYKVYRALVRAKVLAIRAHQERSPVPADFERLITLAESYTLRRKPRLILTHGLSGSGKSWVAGQLVERHGTVRLRSDYVRKQLAGLDPQASSKSQPGEGLYTPEKTAETYARLAELAKIIASTGYSAVVDATFLTSASRAPFLELSAQLGVECTILDVQANEAAIQRRLQQRATDKRAVSEADAAIVARQQRSVEAFSDAERTLVTTIDNSNDGADPALLDALDRLFDADA